MCTWYYYMAQRAFDGSICFQFSSSQGSHACHYLVYYYKDYHFYPYIIRLGGWNLFDGARGRHHSTFARSPPPPAYTSTFIPLTTLLLLLLLLLFGLSMVSFQMCPCRFEEA